RAEARQRAQEMIERMNMAEITGKYAGRLSGGWQRRLSIAMALMSGPKLLFLDEPTLGLDVLARRELWKIIRSLRGQTTVVLTTHYMEEAQALADRIAVMRQGRIAAYGTLDRLREQSGLGQAASLEDIFVHLMEGSL
ncbi:MAG: ABC transporter ATP-binding protein, partial [Clostridia bacterium]|nr:ABC transporter ATP-binding protein [Clostridia bacterium]